MRWSNYLLSTLREAPGDAEFVSHQLLARAGMLMMVAAGIYSFTPMGFRSLDTTIEIVREEMDRTGALEVDLPIAQPKELLGRAPEVGPLHQRRHPLPPRRPQGDRVRARSDGRGGGDRHGPPLGLLVRQLPLTLYQIRTKFRDEIRPRFGLLRGREFLMKDAYSFDADARGSTPRYVAMRAAYGRSSTRCGLEYAVVAGRLGGHRRLGLEEFMVVADTERTRSSSPRTARTRANVEKAITAPLPEPPEKTKSRSAGPTPRRPASSRPRGRRSTWDDRDRSPNTMLYEDYPAEATSFVCAIVIPRRPDDQRGEAPEGARRRARPPRPRGAAPRDRRVQAGFHRSDRPQGAEGAGRSAGLRRPHHGECPQRLVWIQPGRSSPHSNRFRGT